MKNNDLLELTEEQIEKTESRIISDSDLIKGGAEIKKDGRLEITKIQYEEALREMEGGPYYEEVVVNGHKIVLGTLSKEAETGYAYDKDKEFYLLGFPDLYPGVEIAIHMRASYSPYIGPAFLRLWEYDRDRAKEIFNHVVEIAEVEDDSIELYKKTIEYIKSRDEETSE